eukprot:SAG11_NODE_173_length_13507_cov_10.489931_13_plen_195_part_00
MAASHQAPARIGRRACCPCTSWRRGSPWSFLPRLSSCHSIKSPRAYCESQHGWQEAPSSKPALSQFSVPTPGTRPPFGTQSIVSWEAAFILDFGLCESVERVLNVPDVELRTWAGKPNIKPPNAVSRAPGVKMHSVAEMSQPSRGAATPQPAAVEEIDSPGVQATLDRCVTFTSVECTRALLQSQSDWRTFGTD